LSIVANDLSRTHWSKEKLLGYTLKEVNGNEKRQEF
jgi:hypothetical protein